MPSSTFLPMSVATFVVMLLGEIALRILLDVGDTTVSVMPLCSTLSLPPASR